MIRRPVSVLIIAGIVAAFFMWMGLVNIPLAMAQDPPPAPPPTAAKKAPAAPPQETIRLEMAKDLQKKQEELARREELVKAKEDQLKVLEKDIEKKIDELKRTQLKLEDLVKIRDDLEAKNVTNLSKAYSAMTPAEAAQRLKTMDRGIALKILMTMKTKNSSKILSSLDPQTAAQISEQMAKRQME